MAFEASRNLSHLRRIPFGVTNAVSSLHQTIDRITAAKPFRAIFAYLNNITHSEENEEQDRRNLSWFHTVAEK